MAAAAIPLKWRLLRALRVLFWLFAGFVLLHLAYVLAAWIGSSVPRNGDWRESGEGVPILVESNGFHTALVLPLVTPQKDWRGVFPASDLADPSRSYTHVSISWGEREVFLNTPTWLDLSPRTVLRIVGFGGEGLIHVAHYVRPAPGPQERPLTLSYAEYARLVAAIERDLPTGPRVVHRGYDSYDAFYEAPGRYTATNTCNQWTSDRLADAGVRIGWWTPFAGGVTKWFPDKGTGGG